jgi:SanA protein
MRYYYHRASFKDDFTGFLNAVLYIIVVIFLFLILLLIITLGDISRMSCYTYNTPLKIPHNRTGLVLGTSKYLAEGGLNQYFINRIDAATELYNAGKIDYIVVSGDNALKAYNEPREMRKALMQRGIPKEKIYLDYAGFRTLDSVVRAEQIFRQRSITIITQDFHNERAIYIARHHKIDAIGYNAKPVGDTTFTSSVREFFARIKCIFDVYILESKPKFLGETIEIGKTNIDPKHAQLQDTKKTQEIKKEIIQNQTETNEISLPSVLIDIYSKDKLKYDKRKDSGN